MPPAISHTPVNRTTAFADGHRKVAPVYLYRFDFATPLLRLARLHAAHATELPFVWGNLGSGRKDPTFALGGRKAGTPPWRPDDAAGARTTTIEGWDLVAPSAVAYPGHAAPRALTGEEIAATTAAFADAARRAAAAGYDVVELHGAHGYLIHQFLAPGSNHRADEYGA